MSEDPTTRPLLVAAFDPARWLGRARRKLGAYLALHLLSAAAATAVVLTSPMESWVAKLGGALCLTVFLASPPILRGIRASVRPADVRRRFWTWRAPAVAEAEAAPETTGVATAG